MRLLKTMQGYAIALATVGIVLPQGVTIGAERTQNQAFRMADVALAAGGVLKGQVVNAQGIAQAGRTVSVQGQGKELAKLTTNAQGEFSAPGLSGGVYFVSTDGAAGPVRAWAPNTAPPAAANAIMLVPGDQTARGQVFGNGGLFQNGLDPMSLASNPGVWITAALVGTILAVAIDQNSGS